jgi:acyl phosphate:glycerol-3-phosphate acyltransferase
MMTALAVLLGYLLGSIPFGLLLTKAAGAPDVRTIGSGNIGATNVLRTGRKGLAALTLLLDAFKGTAAVLLAAYVAGEDASLAAGLAAFLGHIFPVWLKFKGGKGVATYIGVLLGVYWPAMLICVAVWLAVAFATRYSSLAALVASALTPLALYLLGQPAPALLFFALTILLWVTHRANIARLMSGSEGKIGGR